MIKLSSLTSNVASVWNGHVPLLEKTPTLQEKVTAPAANFSSYFAALQRQVLPNPGDRVSLNPQPLPPKEHIFSSPADALSRQGIIIVGGRGSMASKIF